MTLHLLLVPPTRLELVTPGASIRRSTLELQWLGARQVIYTLKDSRGPLLGQKRSFDGRLLLIRQLLADFAPGMENVGIEPL